METHLLKEFGIEIGPLIKEKGQVKGSRLAFKDDGERQQPHVLIIGAGVAGCMSAWCLADNGYKVTMLADTYPTFPKDQGARLTSQIGAALWEFPCPPCGPTLQPHNTERIRRWALQSYEIYSRLAERDLSLGSRPSVKGGSGGGSALSSQPFGVQMRRSFALYPFNPERFAPERERLEAMRKASLLDVKLTYEDVGADIRSYLQQRIGGISKLDASKLVEKDAKVKKFGDEKNADPKGSDKKSSKSEEKKAETKDKKVKKAGFDGSKELEKKFEVDLSLDGNKEIYKQFYKDGKMMASNGSGEDLKDKISKKEEKSKEAADSKMAKKMMDKKEIKDEKSKDEKDKKSFQNKKDLMSQKDAKDKKEKTKEEEIKMAEKAPGKEGKDEVKKETEKFLAKSKDEYQIVDGTGHEILEAMEHTAPVIDTDAAMRFLLLLLRAKHVNMVKGHVPGALQRAGQAEQLLREYGADAIVNAAGNGAAVLAEDTQLAPARGALLRYRNRGSAAIRDAFVVNSIWVDDHDITYVVPRNDDTLVVGTFFDERTDPGQTAEEVSPPLSTDSDLVRNMRERAEAAFPRLRELQLVPEYPLAQAWRPCRKGDARVEREGLVVHNYGHGVYGWSTGFGAATEVVALVDALVAEKRGGMKSKVQRETKERARL